MKIVLAASAAAAAAAAAVSLFAFATQPALADMDHANMKHESGKAASAAMTEGTIKKVDKAANKLTIAHGPIENLGMPAMTMAFPVKDAAQLDQLKAGDKIRFRAEQVNGAITVVALEPVK
jgi:Cu/Ag efflux protein CusF